LYEDELVLAFLDLHPIREGHALIIPKQHYPWFEDMPEQVTARRCCHVN
jgi:histidine triad (HIT) family protein